MVCTPHAALVIGRVLPVPLPVVHALVDPRQPCDPDASYRDGARVPQEADVGRDPAAMVELPEVVRGLVVAADEDGEDRSDELTRVVLVEAEGREVSCSCHLFMR